MPDRVASGGSSWSRLPRLRQGWPIPSPHRRQLSQLCPKVVPAFGSGRACASGPLATVARLAYQCTRRCCTPPVPRFCAARTPPPATRASSHICAWTANGPAPLVRSRFGPHLHPLSMLASTPVQTDHLRPAQSLPELRAYNRLLPAHRIALPHVEGSTRPTALPIRSASANRPCDVQTALIITTDRARTLQVRHASPLFTLKYLLFLPVLLAPASTAIGI